MGNILGNILGGLEGAATGMLTGGPPGAIAGGVSGIINGGGGPSGVGNISSQTDPTIALSQSANRAYEYATFALNAEQMRHQLQMQVQTNQFNDVQDEKSEQMREINTLREVSMKQREADDKIVKEFIKTAGGE